MWLGVEIGGTKLQLGVGDARGRLRALERRNVVRRRGAPGILQQIREIAPPLIQRYRVRAIGVGFGGPVDWETGRAVRSHQIAGWDNFPVRRWFERNFGLPVVVENDQNVAGLAEAVCGAGRGKRRVLYVTVGTGIGGGLILNGEIYNGRYGAAELGHMRVPVGERWVTVESLASGLAVESGRSTPAKSGHWVGVAIANAIAIVNPEIVIVGGGVSRAGEKFFRSLRRTVARLVFPVFRNNFRIMRPTLGETVVVVGAVLLANRMKRK